MPVPETTPTDDRPAGITCGKYVRGEGKRCRHYLENGGCSLPDELMCVEWMKRNGGRPPAAPVIDNPPKDLFGKPLPAPPASRPKEHQAVPSAKPRTTLDEFGPDVEPEPPVRGLTTEDIESFKALGVEVCIRSESLGDIWLVPAYTGQDRREITPEHAATIAAIARTFPGSQVVAFEKKPPESPAKKGSPA